jgi:hypothetical protein
MPSTAYSHAFGRRFLLASCHLEYSRITPILARRMPGVSRAVCQHCTEPVRALLLLGVQPSQLVSKVHARSHEQDQDLWTVSSSERHAVAAAGGLLVRGVDFELWQRMDPA